MKKINNFKNYNVVLFSKSYRLSDLYYMKRCLANFYKLYSMVGIDFKYKSQLSNFGDAKKAINNMHDTMFFVVDVFNCLTLLAYSILLLRKLSVTYWIQGTIPDESYMRHHSNLKRIILLMLDGIAVRFSRKLIVVSEKHKNLLIKRYGKNIADKIFVLPNLLWKDEIRNKPLRLNNIKHISFCYVGGISKWQNIDIIHAFLSYLCDSLQKDGYTISIKILTPKKNHKFIYDLFSDIANKTQFVLVEAEPLNVPDEIQDCDFGFLIRDNSIVNQVSSPLKLSDYLRAGVRPIVSGRIGVLSQFPVLEKNNIVYHLDFDKLNKGDIKEYERAKNWVLDILHVPFPVEVIRSKFVFDNYVQEFKGFIER